ncbi:MAG: mechanosensitive ion channel [Candidatus Eisenbacteria bacterium]|nr:mechanosensitive ion channel [Candidatus Eisenbacteria bacterium]
MSLTAKLARRCMFQLAPASVVLVLTLTADGLAGAIGEGAAGTPDLSREFLRFVIWLPGSFVAGKIVLLIWNWVLLPIARRTRTSLDVVMLEGSRASVQWAVFLAGLNMAARASFQGAPAVTESVAWTVLRGALYVAVVLALTSVAYSFARAFTEWYGKGVGGGERPTSHDQVVTLLRKIAKFVFFFIAFTIIFDHFGVQIAGVLATAGVVSLAVAFAAQETIANMIAGFALTMDRPFRPGDRVELANGKMGDVLEIGFRSTRILAFDNTVINIPNSEIAKNQIVNQSTPTPLYKIRSKIGVSYGTDLRKAKRILLEIFRAHPEVLKDPAPGVYFTEFGDSSLELFYVCWVADYRNQFRIRDELNMSIKDRFEGERVEIPFPQRDIHVRQERAWLQTSGSNRGVAVTGSHKQSEKDAT